MRKIKIGFYILVLISLIALAMLANTESSSKILASIGIILGSLITYDLKRTNTQNS